MWARFYPLRKKKIVLITRGKFSAIREWYGFSVHRNDDCSNCSLETLQDEKGQFVTWGSQRKNIKRFSSVLKILRGFEIIRFQRMLCLSSKKQSHLCNLYLLTIHKHSKLWFNEKKFQYFNLKFWMNWIS